MDGDGNFKFGRQVGRSNFCLSLQTFRPSNPGGRQEHISLITNSFFNDFAFIIQFQDQGYLNSWLYFISFSFTTGNFCTSVYNLEENLLFFTLILGSVFSDYVVFYGDVTLSTIGLCLLVKRNSKGARGLSFQPSIRKRRTSVWCRWMYFTVNTVTYMILRSVFITVLSVHC